MAWQNQWLLTTSATAAWRDSTTDCCSLFFLVLFSTEDYFLGTASHVPPAQPNATLYNSFIINSALPTRQCSVLVTLLEMYNWNSVYYYNELRSILREGLLIHVHEQRTIYNIMQPNATTENILWPQGHNIQCNIMNTSVTVSKKAPLCAIKVHLSWQILKMHLSRIMPLHFTASKQIHKRLSLFSWCCIGSL